MTIPTKYQSDHLFLLVGANPLPNYVVGLLLTSPGATIHLLHSTAAKATNTEQVAKFLEKQLQGRDRIIYRHPLHEADGQAIRTVIKQIRQTSEYKVQGRIGLNYTGGTKPMAIHAYLALQAEFPKGVIFSYLEAQTMKLYVEQKNGNWLPYAVASSMHVVFETLFALHGYKLEEQPRRVPHLETFVEAIAQVHARKDGFRAWRNWLYQVHRTDGKQIPPRPPLTDLPDPNYASYVELRDVRLTMDKICGGLAYPDVLAFIINEKFTNLNQGFTWLQSTWLEEWALMAVLAVQENFPFEDIGISLKPKPNFPIPLLTANPPEYSQKATNFEKNFELDVAVTVGYQLFVISCIASEEAGGETKKHLFEAFVRARQLGGDEARVALVCCVDQPLMVEREIQRDWHAYQQIKVLGRPQLLNLSAELYQWFDASRRVL